MCITINHIQLITFQLSAILTLWLWGVYEYVPFIFLLPLSYIINNKSTVTDIKQYNNLIGKKCEIESFFLMISHCKYTENLQLHSFGTFTMSHLQKQKKVFLYKKQQNIVTAQLLYV